MTLTIKDLQVVLRKDSCNDCLLMRNRCHHKTRPASPGELVAAVKTLDGVEESVRPHPTGGWPQRVLVVPTEGSEDE